jgi:hypothetical protein
MDLKQLVLVAKLGLHFFMRDGGLEVVCVQLEDSDSSIVLLPYYVVFYCI